MHAHPDPHSRQSTALRGLVFAKYGDRAASTRQRFVQAAPYLAEPGITLHLSPLFDNTYLEDLFVRGTRNRGHIICAYFRRLHQLITRRDYDFVVIQYELFPYLPAWFEALIGIIKKPIILDYDDAIFHQYDQHPKPLVRSILGTKLMPLLKRADLSICGNAYLESYAARYCKRTIIIPTTVDTNQYLPAPVRAPNTPPILGWIGSPSTWNYCLPLLDTVSYFTQQHRLHMLVVGAGKNAKPREGFTLRDWIEEKEIADVQTMDIGMMPIPDEPWARGKCGYKLIQYMACGLPVVASPVGVNTTIVEHGVNGFLASTVQEWHSAIEQLLSDSTLRERMGKAGRARAEAHYSIQQHGPRMATIIAQICEASSQENRRL